MLNAVPCLAMGGPNAEKQQIGGLITRAQKKCLL
jgi:hypothetical protein